MESEVIPTLRELGIGFVAYSPLGRGFLTGAFKSPDDLAENDGGARVPASRARTSPAISSWSTGSAPSLKGRA
jgi:aryl-alcohol dehydrogenase-like predicted oxidoreductase